MTIEDTTEDIKTTTSTMVIDINTMVIEIIIHTIIEDIGVHGIDGITII